jgi:tripartite-type tricarboxylate transporter receptor subunit TctC
MSVTRWTPAMFALMCALLHTMPDARAQAYPQRPVRYLIPTSAGAGADVLGRIVAGGLSEVLGQQFIVDNRVGAAGNIGAALAAKAPPDGYTIFQVTFQHTLNVTLYRNLQYDLVRDFAAITQLGTSPAVVVVHPSLPVKSIAELVRLAKAKRGAINYGSAGFGSPTFVAAELFKRAADVDVMHVPYRGGGEALVAILTGETQLYFAPLTALPHIKQGRLRPLAMTSSKRLPLAPDYPTVAESGYPGYEFGFWHGLMVPAGTAGTIMETIHKSVLTVLDRSDTKERMRDLGYTAIGDTPREFAQYIRSDIEKWRRILGDKRFADEAR